MAANPQNDSARSTMASTREHHQVPQASDDMFCNVRANLRKHLLLLFLPHLSTGYITVSDRRISI
jgi:hypothetical protein